MDWEPFLETCHRFSLPAALEKSRSGNGGHVWMFFDRTIGAGLARRLGSFLLTETLERRPGIGLQSYDRLFPNQDTMPKGGFGNLIALPLQGAARPEGNSVFLDDRFTAHADQWAFLSGIPRIGTAQVEEIVQGAEGRGGILRIRVAPQDEDDDTPWTLPASRKRKVLPLEEPLPDHLEIVLGDRIYLPKESVGPRLLVRLIRLAAFQNPEFYKTQAMRQSTFRIPRVIGWAQDHPQHLSLPRGCLEDLQLLLAALKIPFSLWDERFPGTPLGLTFQGTLRGGQEHAAKAMLAHDTGILAATTAFGKTVIGAWLIARRQVNTLVVVHRRQLLDQWVERLATFLGVPTKSIGRIGGGRRKPTGRLDVAVMQSLVRGGIVDDCIGEYGHVIFDECHHLAAERG